MGWSHRGYYFDEETGLYYLQSRYYNPVVCRFLCADAQCVTVLDTLFNFYKNHYTYCSNSPVSSSDKCGFFEDVLYSGFDYQLFEAIAMAGAAFIVELKAFIASLWNIVLAAVILGAFLATLIALIYIVQSVVDSINNAVEKEQTKDNLPSGGNYYVYVLTRESKNKDSIFYVGRTIHLSKRFNHHIKEKTNCYMYVVYACENLAESRLCEQVTLAACLTMNLPLFDFGMNTKTFSNKINGIAKYKVSDVVNELKDNMDNICSLLGCTADSDWLTMCGY